MRRLFLHFYGFLLLALLGIGWSVEQLWPQAPQLPAWVLTLGSSLAYQLQGPEHSPAQIASQLGLTLTYLDATAIPWSDAERWALERGQLVPLFDQQHVWFYQLDPQQQQLLQFGPLQLDQTASSQNYLVLLFFCLLAIALALWLWPLARDIQRLQQQLWQFGQGMQSPTQPLSSHSLLAPIARSLQQMATRIQQLLTLQKEMTQAVSHDLRTPLARLRFALSMHMTDSPEQHAMLHDIDEMQTLIEQMLDYARLQADGVKLHASMVDVVELSQNLCEKLNTMPGPQIQCVLHGDDSNYLLWADGHYLERALTNVLQNGKNFAAQQVQCHIDADPQRLRVIIDDDGPGIPLEQQTAVLQPFVRLDQSRSKKVGGFGLGLTIVQRILSWHHATLQLDTAPLGGARFILDFPRLTPGQELTALPPDLQPDRT